jgi:hypothetical protein
MVSRRGGKLIVNLISRIRTWLAENPAITAWFFNGGAALFVAYALGLDHIEEAAIATIISAAATVYTAVRARPVAIPLLIGALVTGITAAGAFGFQPSAKLIGLLVALGSLVPAFGFHLTLKSKAYLKQAQRSVSAVRDAP